MSVIVKGHAHHYGTQILVIEGRTLANNDTYRNQNAESKAICGFLREHLPSGTLGLLAVRLCGNALDQLIDGVRLDDLSDANEVREACKELVAELDKET